MILKAVTLIPRELFHHYLTAFCHYYYFHGNRMHEESVLSCIYQQVKPLQVIKTECFHLCPLCPLPRSDYTLWAQLEPCPRAGGIRAHSCPKIYSFIPFNTTIKAMYGNSVALLPTGKSCLFICLFFWLMRCVPSGHCC